MYMYYTCITPYILEQKYIIIDACACMYTHDIVYSALIDHNYYKYEKHFQKMYRDVGMAMPKTTETTCRDGSVQGRHVIQRLHN